eukprot:m.94051 g.94051  ORF g.94051 m.94051 type:complete len:631 (+) comp12204_c0_seq1:161-2053(+)
MTAKYHEGESGGGGKEVDPEHPPLDRRELKAWYTADFANSVYFQVVGGYLALLMQQVAMEKAGFPDQCPNYAAVRGNRTLSTLIFGNPEDDFFIDNLKTGKSECASDCAGFQGTSYCKGVPQSTLECLTLDGNSRHSLRVSAGDWQIEASEYALLFAGLSVAAQVIAFLSLGALGDFGRLRKRVFAVCTWLGSASLIATLAVTPDRWWLAGAIVIVSNVLFGIANLMYNAWLPLLVTAHWEYLALPLTADAEDRRLLFDKIAGTISAYGYVYGYAGGIICLLITIPIALTTDSASFFRWSVVLAGAWWFTFSWYPIVYLKERPGPPLPDGQTSYVRQSLKEFKTTFGRLRELPSTFKFTVCWFLYSEGFNAIALVAILFANSEVNWGCIPPALGIAVLLLGLPLLAMAGLVFVEKYAAKRGWQPKTLIIICLAIYTSIPIYGLIGFATEDAGMHHGWELFIALVVYGLPLGVVQSYSRSYFSNIIPAGYESQFFSLFEITDKGSSIVSPIVASQIAANAELRWTFLYILIMQLVPALMLIPLDPVVAREQAHEYARRNPRNTLAPPASKTPSAGMSDEVDGASETLNNMGGSLGEGSFLGGNEGGAGLMMSPGGSRVVDLADSCVMVTEV